MTSWQLIILCMILKKTQIVSAKYIQYSSKQSMCLLLLSIHEMCVPVINLYILSASTQFNSSVHVHRKRDTTWNRSKSLVHK